MQDKILMVDDEQAVLNVMCDAIERWGYHIICTPNAEDAMTIFLKEKPFLVLTDLRLYGPVDGALLADRMHRNNPLAIFVALTGYAQSFGFGHLLGNVFTDVLLKPVTLSLLKEVIETAHKKHTRWMEYLYGKTD